MSKLYSILIYLSFLGLWITSIVPAEFEILLGFMLIFSFGILHGANDILLINVISNHKKKDSFLKVLIVYLLTVFSAVALFYFIPLVALILFILFSAYHFGEQHWESKVLGVSKTISHTYYFVYGLFLFMLLFIFNTTEVIEVIKAITRYTVNDNTIIYSFAATAYILLFIAVRLFYKSSAFKAIALRESFNLLVFTLIFKVSTLIWGFAIYFILWHSIPSLFEQISFIYGRFSKVNVVSYVKRAFPYWLISLIGMAIVIFVFQEEKLLYAIIFSFIAAVTFPHAIVITKMFKQKKNAIK
ncbi:Brp/Blh family beta-carotene 15,15'-dioxygenase [Lacinutrix sp. Hel_I_90]|uniref:Brp/Blh family beta-carotene 15,15'-dioxygenase n=1 Tax=Lacinutrix sp. Hel_I_90 TaxID=1249999 RepID=UPI0005C96341|nr:Brp/Blh family beta-carotene 15,15'-dioxygenase [Lacinutrix sp. Hel_I_90]